MTTVMESVRLSTVAYLQQEETPGSKSGYLAGKLFPMAGGTAHHNRIAVSAVSPLYRRVDWSMRQATDG